MADPRDTRTAANDEPAQAHDRVRKDERRSANDGDVRVKPDPKAGGDEQDKGGSTASVETIVSR